MVRLEERETIVSVFGLNTDLSIRVVEGVSILNDTDLWTSVNLRSQKLSLDELW